VTVTRPIRVRPAPLTRNRALVPKQPAFWVTVGLLAFGAWKIGTVVISLVSWYPGPALVAGMLFLLYTVPFILLVSHVDYLEREPFSLLTVALLWGGLVATSLALPANSAGRNIVAKLTSPWTGDSWGPALTAPPVEETLKALGVVMIVLLARSHINSVVDGFVYGAFVGLGFQVVEDFTYAVGAVADADGSGSGDLLSPVFGTFVVRGFLGGLWTHTMFTALAGAGIAYAVVHTDYSRRRRIMVALLALVGACAMHFVWNAPWFMDGFDLGLGGLVLALIIKGLPGFIVVILLLRYALEIEADFYTPRLVELNDPEIITPGEAKALRSVAGRIQARRYARRRAGPRAGRAVRLLQRAQTRLAVELARGAHLEEQPTVRLPLLASVVERRGSARERRRREVLQARERLRRFGITEAVAPQSASSRTWVGMWALGVGLIGLLAPGPSVGAVGLGLWGLYRTRHSSEEADKRVVDGLVLGCLGIALWTITFVLRHVNG